MKYKEKHFKTIVILTVKVSLYSDWRGEGSPVHGGPGPDYRGVEGYSVNQGG